MTGDGKGERLEELIRSYFDAQGYFALRSVPYRVDKQDVTDIDVWLYRRDAPGNRLTTVVDIKDRARSRAFERILWTKGLQSLVGADRGMIVSRDASPEAVRLARAQGISFVGGGFVSRLKRDAANEDTRITLEQFETEISGYAAQREDGGWLDRIRRTKAGLVSQTPFRAFNAAAFQTRFFADRVATRPQHADLALRCALLSSALACIALDTALDALSFAEAGVRERAIIIGATYGDADDETTQRTLNSMLQLVATGLDNGRAIAAQLEDTLERRIASMPAKMLAEFFSRLENQDALFGAARELDRAAHLRGAAPNTVLSPATKGVLGVLADFGQADRRTLLGLMPPASPLPEAQRLDQAPGNPAGDKADQDSPTLL